MATTSGSDPNDIGSRGKHVALVILSRGLPEETRGHAIPSTQGNEVNTWPSLSYVVAAVRKDVAITIPSMQGHEVNTSPP
jgi:hypothetical protein